VAGNKATGDNLNPHHPAEVSGMTERAVVMLVFVMATERVGDG